MLHFLVAVDGSANSLDAVRWVAGIGAGGDWLRCTLLNVQKPIMSGEVGILAPASIALDERNRSAADILAQAAEAMRRGRIPFTTEERLDDAAAAIVARAGALSCDAIVMGRRGLGAVRAALLGSVSTEVVRRSDVPVIAVRSPVDGVEAAPPRVLLAVDGSESALRAATFAARFVHACRGEVHVLQVQPGITLAGSILGPREALIDQWSGKHAQAALAGARGALDSAGVRYVEHIVARDDVPGAIAETAKTHACGLVVMGTRGLGPLTGLLLGSVAHGVLELAPANVTAVALVR